MCGDEKSCFIGNNVVDKTQFVFEWLMIFVERELTLCFLCFAVVSSDASAFFVGGARTLFSHSRSSANAQ
jgi:hypothetical protein